MRALVILLVLCAPVRAAGKRLDPYCGFQEHQWKLDQRNPGGRRAAQGIRARLYRHIRDLAVDYFEQDRDNPDAARTAAFLKTSTVTLRLDDLRWMASGSLTIMALFDGAENAITLATDHPVLAAPDDAFMGIQLDKLRPSLPDLAPTMVHETRHARDHAALGALPSADETELLAYAEETMYVWRRLGKDPGYLGLDKLDARLRAHLAWPSKTPWWNDPLDYGSLASALDRLKKFPDAAHIDPVLMQYWVLLHSMAGGYEIFEGNLHQFGLLNGESMFAWAAHTLNYEAAARRHLEIVSRCARATAFEGLRRELDIRWNVLNEERRRRDLMVTYNQPAKNYFVIEIIKQKREVDALVGRP